MTIQLNGQAYDVPVHVSTIQQLLEHLNIDHRILVIEHNATILEKDAYDAPIRDRDQIEVIHFVGGG
ncbi:sulfur carrier protein ThiS [Planococcaceae bacterium Storch 2/2-2]|nr:sulfur carrier protein ThiS [Planococcaceae bacterium Storch 2/2-2]